MLTIGLGLAAAVSLGVAATAWVRQKRAAAAAAGALALVLVLAAYLYPRAGETGTATVAPSSASGANMDLDGNSVPDLALYNGSARSISVWLMKPGQPVAVDSTPSLQPPQTGWEPVAAAAAVDGRPGIVLQNSTTRQISMWVLGGNTPTDLARSIELPLIPMEGWSVAAAADFDKNGYADLLLWNARTREASVWFLAGEGAAKTVQSTPVLGSAVEGWAPVAACDFDGNGRGDVVLQNATTREVSIWLMGGAAGLERIATPVVQASAEGWAVRGCSDFDANGTSDLVLENQTAGSVSLWLMGRNGTVQSTPVIGPVNKGWRILPSGY